MILPRPVARPAALYLPLLLLVSLLVACSNDGNGDSPGSTPVSKNSPSTTGAQPGTGSQPANRTDMAVPEGERSPTPQPTEPAPTAGLPPVNLERVFPDLAFQRMTGAYQDGEGHWYITEQEGRIQRIDSSTGQATVWLDLSDRVDDSGNEMGLLGFALAPDFDTSHAFYVDYTGGGQTVVSRFTASDDHGTAFEDSEQPLLRLEQPFSNHNGGQIGFGPDGYLYIALGDGGNANDPTGNGQNLGTLLASILRIDVSGDAADYEVPSDNPFVDQQGARGEIWAHGLRNPWRFSFDSETDDLWVGDVGQNAREEINIITRGGNYGWNIMEGSECRGGGTACDMTGLVPPVFDYATGSGGTCSVTGGFVYRGSAIPGLRGAYVFSDYCSGTVFALRVNQDGDLTEQGEIATTDLRVSSLAQDNDGELYLLDLSGGGIHKLVP